MIDAFIEQAGINPRPGLVSEAWRMQQIQHHLVLRNGQRPRGFRPRTGSHRRRGQPRTPTLHAGARDSERGTGRFGHAAGWCECHDGVRHSALSLGPVGSPAGLQTFFWMSMMASACVRRRVRRALSC